MVTNRPQQIRLVVALGNAGGQDGHDELRVLRANGQSAPEPVSTAPWTVEPTLIGGQLLDSGDRELQLGGVVTKGGALGDTSRFGDGRVGYPVVPVSRQSPQGRRGESLVDRFVLLPSAAYPLAGDG